VSGTQGSVLSPADNFQYFTGNIHFKSSISCDHCTVDLINIFCQCETQTADCRLQTGGKMQTADRGKMQTDGKIKYY